MTYRTKSRILFVLLFCVIVSLITVAYHISKPHYEYEWKAHIVAPGDTLWTIARGSNLREDLRDIVYMINEKNRISSGHIESGDIIEYPVLKEHK